MRRAPERTRVRARFGLKHRGQPPRHFFEVQINQLDDEVRLALGLHLLEAGEHAQVNGAKGRVVARARPRHRPAVCVVVCNVDGHHSLLSPASVWRGSSVAACAN